MLSSQFQWGHTSTFTVSPQVQCYPHSFSFTKGTLPSTLAWKVRLKPVDWMLELDTKRMKAKLSEVSKAAGMLVPQLACSSTLPATHTHTHIHTYTLIGIIADALGCKLVAQYAWTSKLQMCVHKCLFWWYGNLQILSVSVQVFVLVKFTLNEFCTLRWAHLQILSVSVQVFVLVKFTLNEFCTLRWAHLQILSVSVQVFVLVKFTLNEFCTLRWAHQNIYFHLWRFHCVAPFTNQETYFQTNDHMCDKM